MRLYGIHQNKTTPMVAHAYSGGLIILGTYATRCRIGSVHGCIYSGPKMIIPEEY